VLHGDGSAWCTAVFNLVKGTAEEEAQMGDFNFPQHFILFPKS
jgi:hypothetical protein